MSELILNFSGWTFAGWLWSVLMLGLYESGRTTMECPTREARQSNGRRAAYFALASGLLLALFHLVFFELAVRRG